MKRPDRVTRLIRIIAIQSEVTECRCHPNTDPLRFDALNLILAEASKDLTKDDHFRIRHAGLQTFSKSSEIMHEWNKRDAELEEFDRQRNLAQPPIEKMTETEAEEMGVAGFELDAKDELLRPHNWVEDCPMAYP